MAHTVKRFDESVPVDEHGRFVDSGYWRDTGRITHWHLIAPREWSMDDPARFDTGRMRAERVRSSAGVARSPQEVADWLTATMLGLVETHRLGEETLRQSGIATEADRFSKAETQFRMAMFGMDVCSMLAVGSRRIVHYSAYAMTVRDCSAPH